MSTIRRSLAWKEWQEHKWKLVSITAIMWSLAACVAFLHIHQREVFVWAFLVSIALAALPATIFIGLGIAAGERSRGTLRFLQALPVPLWRVALHKLGFGLLSVVIPIMLTLLFIAVISLCLLLLGFDMSRLLPGGENEVGSLRFLEGVLVVLIVSSATASLLIWAAAWGVNRADEISAGAVSLAVMVGWWVLLAVGWNVMLMGSTGVDTARLRAVGVGSAPLGFLMVPAIAERDTIGSISLGLMSAVLVHGLLAAKYMFQFGRAGDAQVRSPRAAMVDLIRSDWLAPPRRWPLTAIAWKQLRESGPIALTGLAGIVGIVAILSIAQRVQGPDTVFSEPIGTIYTQVAIIFGFFVALVVGIGVALNDLSPRLNTFWRSRPIHPSAWFWCKYITGLAIVLASIYVPIVLVTAVTDPAMLDSTTIPDILVIPAAHLAIFAAAVAMTCLVRHAVYAAILSFGLLYLGLVTVWLAIGGARLLGWLEPRPEGVADMTSNQIAIGMLFNFVVCTLLAWLAMRYDWGHKSRY